MSFDDLDVCGSGDAFERRCRPLDQLHRQVHRRAHAGRPDDGNRRCRLAQKLLLVVVQPGGGHDERNLPLDADGSDRFRCDGDRKINYNVRRYGAETVHERNAKWRAASQRSGVLSQIRLSR